MTYNPPTAQVTAQKDVTYGNVQPNTKSKKKEPSSKKTEIIINPSKKDCQENRTMRFSEFVALNERGDFWHPDPEKDRRLGGPGANQRAREDRAEKPKEDPKKLKPGESYMDYHKRQQASKKSSYMSSGSTPAERLRKAGATGGSLNNSFDMDSEVIESHVPGKPAERLGAVTAIPQKERDAARERLLAKTKEIRNKKKIREEVEQIDEISQKTATRAYAHSYTGEFEGQDSPRDVKRTDNLRKHIKRKFGDKAAQHADRAGHSMTFGRKGAGGMPSVKEELEIEEGLDMKTFKANRKKNERRAASADAEKRGHVGKEWHNTGRKYSADEAKSRRANMSDDERAARHRAAVDPDDDRDENTYSADRTKNPKKQRKQAAMGEALSFSDFMEARRMDKEGVDRNDTARKNRTMAAKASLAAKQKRQAVLDKHEKKTGTKLDISRSKEGREHAANFPGSRQEPKERGKKETPQETQNRRVNRQVDRVVKHGYTSKEKKHADAMAKHTSRFD